MTGQDKKTNHEQRCTQLEKKARDNYWHGFVLGAAITGLGAALLCKSCDCTGTNNITVYDHASDAGIDTGADVYDAAGNLSLYDAGVADAGDSCYGPKHVSELEQKLNQCGKELEECREENAGLSKRPESCPIYKQKACPPVKPFPAYRRE